MIKNWYLLVRSLVIITTLVLFVLFGFYIFTSQRVTGDAASHLLLAVSPILKIGVPYKDFWDIKPPMMPLLLFGWGNIFGFGINSIRFINILLSMLSVSLTYFIYNKLFKTPVFEIVFLSTILVLLSPILHSIMLPTEILGLTTSLLALYLLISSNNDFSKYFFSGLLFFLASQSKEPFTFTAIAVLPNFAYSFFAEGSSKLIKNIVVFMFGTMIGFAIIFVYLNTLGSFGSYKEVLVYKSSIYEFTYENLTKNFGRGIAATERTFTEFSSGILILFILSFASLIISNKYKKIFTFSKSGVRVNSFCILNNELSTNLSVIFYSIGSFVGFGLGNNFGSHYLIQVVVPLYILFGSFISYLFENASCLFNKSRKRFLVVSTLFLASIIIILPKRQYLKSFLPIRSNIVMSDEVHNSEKRIIEITTRDQCILSVYGWGVGENYLYSGRRPCTRYFLPNIVAKDWQKREYRRSIQENPPAAIMYRTEGPDMNIDKFEVEVINIGKIVKNCYVRDTIEDVIYVSKTKNLDQLKNCIKDNTM